MGPDDFEPGQDRESLQVLRAATRGDELGLVRDRGEIIVDRLARDDELVEWARFGGGRSQAAGELVGEKEIAQGCSWVRQPTYDGGTAPA